MLLEKIEDISLSFPSFSKETIDELNETLRLMKRELDNNKDLHGISAPMVDKYYRIIALQSDNEARSFINPVFSKRDKLILSREKFLDKGQEYLVPRFNEISFIYTKTNGTTEEAILKGSAACLFQQMYDTLDGVMLEDYGLPIDEDFDELDEEDKNTICNQYLENLKIWNDTLKEEIYNDEYLSGQQRAIDFASSVARGETKLAEPQPNRASRRANKKNAKRMAKAIRV